MLSNFNHLLINADSSGIGFAAELIKNGEIVAFPTETVYGLGANALNADAVRSIFVAKGRPLTDPLIVHTATTEEAVNLLDLQIEERVIFDSLTTAFWPGPLTIIAKAASCVPSCVTAETGFVGLRRPAHPLAVQLLISCGLPIAAPSANRFGHVSPTRAEHVLADLGTKEVRVLNGDADPAYSSLTCEHGIESTVVRLDGSQQKLCIFRQGAITQHRLENCLLQNASKLNWSVVVVSRVVKMEAAIVSCSDSDAAQLEDGAGCDQNHKHAHIDKQVSHAKEGEGQLAPGQAITHYSPDAPCFIVRNIISDTITDTVTGGDDSIPTECVTPADLRSVVVLDFGGQLLSIADSVLAYRDLSVCRNAREGARRIFECLRWAESVSGVRCVYLAPIETVRQSSRNGSSSSGNSSSSSSSSSSSVIGGSKETELPYVGEDSSTAAAVSGSADILPMIAMLTSSSGSGVSVDVVSDSCSGSGNVRGCPDSDPGSNPGPVDTGAGAGAGAGAGVDGDIDGDSLLLGLADRVFRSASGRVIQLQIL